MHIPKPSDADTERFRNLVPYGPGIEVKTMFGNLGASFNGNMFAGTFGPTIGVKLSDTDRQELAGLGATQFGPPEGPMGGYLALPESILARTDEAADWVHRALDHAAALPAKKPTPKR